MALDPAKGSKVRVKSLLSHRGTALESLEPEHVSKTIGRIMTDPDAVGWVQVRFPTCDAHLQAPIECLEVVR